jgi:hypothetical protein
MKYYVQEMLEEFIEKNSDYESVAEKMWQEHNKGQRPNYEKYAYVCGVYQAMLWSAVFTMQKALDKLNELHPGEE